MCHRNDGDGPPGDVEGEAAARPYGGEWRSSQHAPALQPAIGKGGSNEGRCLVGPHAPLQETIRQRRLEGGDGAGLVPAVHRPTELGKSEVLQAGASGNFQVSLRAGTYQIWCAVDSHKARGMQGTLTVT